MSDFQHSEMLFLGNDGLPLEFNVRNTTNKTDLKELIEHGSGICTQNENAVHLISPGTKVLNVDLGKKLVSSSYIFDCVKQNCLLEVNDYVFTISEAQTSDISDEDSERLLALRHSTCKSPNKLPLKSMNLGISPIKAQHQCNETGSTTPSNLTLPSSNSGLPQISNSSSTHSESFVEGSQDETSVKITSHIYTGTADNNSHKYPEVLKSGEKLSGWELTDFQSVGSQSLVSHITSNRSEQEMSLCSSIPSSSAVSPLNPCGILNSPKKVYNDHSVNLKKSVNFNIDQCLVASPVNSSMEIDKSVLNTNMERTEFLGSLYKSPKKLIEHCISSSPVNVSMEIDESMANSNVNKTFFQSPNKLDSQILTLPSKNIPMEIDNSVVRNSPKFKKSPLQSPTEYLRLSSSPVKPVNVPLLFCEDNLEVPQKKSVSPIDTVVSSSQPEDDLDNFDNMLLNKIQKKKQLEDEDSLSQSYTVSSSADAQVTSKPCSADDISPELEKNASPLPDSPSLSSEEINIQVYKKQLEREVEEILKKTPPLTIQEKASLVKYVCCTRKLSPASVLASLFTDSLDL